MGVVTQVGPAIDDTAPRQCVSGWRGWSGSLIDGIGSTSDGKVASATPCLQLCLRAQRTTAAGRTLSGPLCSKQVEVISEWLLIGTLCATLRLNNVVRRSSGLQQSRGWVHHRVSAVGVGEVEVTQVGPAIDGTAASA